MPELTINGMSVTVNDGATVLDAADAASVEIPTLCHMKGSRPQTSCMLCVVKNTTTGQLIPACSARADVGMEIETECEEVQQARRDILNLLLSEHVGDCEAPCTRICPAHLDIPHMLREIERDNRAEAEWIAYRDLAIPRTLNHICPAPCEKGCRRGQLDEAISIRVLHGEPYTADVMSRLPKIQEDAQLVAIVGSGAAGLACAWQLRLLGYAVTVLDEVFPFGGALRNIESLPSDILDAEIDFLRAAGIAFEQIDAAVSVKMQAGSEQAIVTHELEHKLAVKAVANGKAAALEWAERRTPSCPTEKRTFDSRIGKLRASEIEQLTDNCSPDLSGYDSVRKEAARCLHCDCRKPSSCRLRQYATRYEADAAEYPADERGHVQLVGKNGAVVFEPGKCIKCGLCIEVARQSDETLGLTFVGRGFNTRVTVPFDEALQAGLRVASEACVEICPTGALAFRDAEER